MAPSIEIHTILSNCNPIPTFSTLFFVHSSLYEIECSVLITMEQTKTKLIPTLKISIGLG